MKKTVCIILSMLILLLFSVPACAEVDLSGMTYDELVELKDKINLALWNSEEWQEVEVPQGVWKVGEDIPVGHWTIKASKETGSTTVYVAWGIKEDGKEVTIAEDHDNLFYWIKIYGEKGNGDLHEWDYDFQEGMYIQIENSNAIFTPYTGKPSLNFRK